MAAFIYFKNKYTGKPVAIAVDQVREIAPRGKGETAIMFKSGRAVEKVATDFEDVLDIVDTAGEARGGVYSILSDEEVAQAQSPIR